MVKVPSLKRSLGLPLVTLYGLGNILGAGIYVLIGKVAGEAGESTSLAFIIAMFVAGVTAFSYMELAGRYPASASVSVYVHKAFGKQWLAVLIGLLMLAGGITSAAALAQGFAGYFSSFIALPTQLASVGLVIVIGLIALKGVGESAKTAAVFTAVEIFGLLLIIWFGRSSLMAVSPQAIISVDPSVGLGGIIGGAFLAFYAFIGFEDMVNVAEETRKPQRTMPQAILIALVISTILYLLVVIVATTLVTPAQLAASAAPLTLVFQQTGAGHENFLSLIGMSAAINGIIVQIIMGSRILYGLSRQGWIHKHFARVGEKNQTPVVATVVIMALIILATLFMPLIGLAQLTSLLVLSIFTLVHWSLIVIKRQHNSHQGYITVPQALPYVGVLACVFMISYQLVSWFG